MASLGLNIHIDKENATPGIGKGDAIRFGPRGKSGKSLHATPRKALYDVNKDMKGTANGEFLKPSIDKIQPQAKLSVRPENQAHTHFANSNSHSKKLSLQENKNLQTKEVKFTKLPVSSNSKSSKPKQKVPPKVEPVEDETDESESEAIWPKAERLSSHMHKLLAWRPPCFFGTTYASDSDNSLSEEDNLDDIDIMERPPCPILEMPELDMARMLAELPDPEKPS